MDRRRPARASRHVLLRATALAGVASIAITTTLAAQAPRRARLAVQRVVAAAPERRSLVAARATSAIVIDGRLDDPAWRDAPVGRDFVQRSPDALQRATQPTEARVLVDDAALYVALRLFDSAPDSILAPLARRDADLYSDWAEVLVDGYLDHNTAFRFMVNPAGVQRDAVISGDDLSNEDAGWDAVWQSATARDSAGWMVELRIPLSQLRFSVAAEGKTRWGLQIGRLLARRNERSYWSPIAPTVAGFVSQFGTLENVTIPRPVRRAEVLPYLSTKVTSAPVDAGNPLARPTVMQRAVGLDLRVGLSQGFTLTGTINPDFGQVEADPSEVNLTGVESFFSERRPFFLEGSSLFAFDMQSTWFTGHEELFYSRRIGRAPQGASPDDARWSSVPAAAPVLGAAKLTGRTVSGWKLAALAAMTGAVDARYVDAHDSLRSSVVEPRTRYGVVRVLRELDAGRASLGSVLTVVDRDATVPSLRTGALVGGVDGQRRFGNGRFIAYGDLLGSTVRGSREAMLVTQRSTTHLFQRPDAKYLGVDSTLKSMGGLAGSVRVTKEGGGHTRGGVAIKATTPGFEANDLGLQPRADAITGLLWAGWVGFTPTRFTREWETWGTLWTGSSFGGERERLGARLFGYATLLNNWSMFGAVERYEPILSLTALRGGPALATPGHTGGFAHVTSDSRNAIVGELDVRGNRDDSGPGRLLSTTTTLSARLGSGIQLSVAPSLSWWRNPQQVVESSAIGGTTHHVVGDLLQSTASLTLRGSYALSSRLSVQLYAQPFVSTGEYRSLGEVASARASRFTDRVHRFAPDSIRVTSGGLAIGTPTGTLAVARPDYTLAQLNANAMLRWEYRPGSTLFVVWSQGRSVEGDPSPFDVGAQTRDLFSTPPTNVLLVKVSHWMGR